MSTLLLISMLFMLGLSLGLVHPLSFFWGLGLTLLFLLGHTILVVKRRNIGLHFVTAFLLGWWAPSPTDEATLDTTMACTRVVEGRVETPFERRVRDYSMRLALHNATGCLDRAAFHTFEPSRGLLYVSLETAAPPNLGRGDRVRLRAYIKPIVRRRNPGSPKWDNSVPQFSATLQSKALITIIKSNPFPYSKPFDALRHRFSRAYDRFLPKQWAGMAKALSLGNQFALSTETHEHFRRTGVAHLLSVSGLHLGLVTLFIYSLIFVALKQTPLVESHDVRQMAAWMTIPAVVGFALITGLRPSVFRAMVMAILALIGRGLGRTSGTQEAICLAAMIVLVDQPELIAHPGFQLSFSAVFGFATVFALRRREIGLQLEEPPPRNLFHRYFSTAILSSIVATSATTPFVIYHFQMLPVMGVVTNLIAIPLVGFVILPLLLLGMVCHLVSEPMFVVVARLAVPFMSLLDGALHYLSKWPIIIEYPNTCSALALCVLAVAVLLWCARVPRGAFVMGIPAFVLLFIGFLFDMAPRMNNGEMVIHFFDVGQGDSALLTTPKGDHLLIDAGGRSRSGFDAGATIVVPALKALGVSRLHAMVISHPDSDHVGGAHAVISRIPVGEIWENGQGEDLDLSGAYKDALSLARHQNIPIKRTPALCGMQHIGGLTINILHPCDHALGYDRTRSTNDNSLVLKVTYKKHTALFLGDIHADIEEALIKKMGTTDILKVAHHGSRTSTSLKLLDSTRPGIAVVSVAPFNHFHMPHRTVLERLHRQHVRILRTDLGGAIKVSADGRRIVSKYVAADE